MTAERDLMTLNEVSYSALGAEERGDEAPRAGRPRPGPDPEVVAKPKRRQFSAEYGLRILDEAERCTRRGEVGRPLRHEGLYSSHLTAWRKARPSGSGTPAPASKTSWSAGWPSPWRYSPPPSRTGAPACAAGRRRCGAAPSWS